MSEKDWDGTLLDWSVKVGLKWRKSFHVYDSSHSEKGWFDRVWLRDGQALFVELKVRAKATGAPNGLSPEQREFQSAGALAGLDVRHWLWPDDWEEAWETLTGKPIEECPYWPERRT
jgi:hypothetical protein